MRLIDRLRIIGFQIGQVLLIVIPILLIIWVSLSVAQCSREVEEKGLKQMLEEVWEGPEHKESK